MVRGRGRKGGVEEFGVLEEACPAAGVAEGADEEEDGVGDEEHGVVKEVGGFSEHVAEVAVAMELCGGGKGVAERGDGVLGESVEAVGLGAKLGDLGRGVHGGEDISTSAARSRCGHTRCPSG